MSIEFYGKKPNPTKHKQPKHAKRPTCQYYPIDADAVASSPKIFIYGEKPNWDLWDVSPTASPKTLYQHLRDFQEKFRSDPTQDHRLQIHACPNILSWSFTDCLTFMDEGYTILYYSDRKRVQMFRDKRRFPSAEAKNAHRWFHAKKGACNGYPDGTIVRYKDRIYRTKEFLNFLQLIDYFSNNDKDYAFSFPFPIHKNLASQITVVDPQHVLVAVRESLKNLYLMSQTLHQTHEANHLKMLDSAVNTVLNEISKCAYEAATKGCLKFKVSFSNISEYRITDCDKYPIVLNVPCKDGTVCGTFEDYLKYLIRRKYSEEFQTENISEILVGLCKNKFPVAEYMVIRSIWIIPNVEGSLNVLELMDIL